MKVHVPMHMTARWLGHELSRLQTAREEGRSTKTKYIHPRKISIRDHIALARKLEKSHESIEYP